MSISKYTFLVGAMTSILAASTAAADDVAASVAARLRESGQLADYRVNVKESEGTVFLEGEVSDARQIAAALAVAENTEGVERVVNRLSLKTAKKRSGITLNLPASMRGLLGATSVEPEAASATGDTVTPQLVAADQEEASMLAMPSSVSSQFGEIELVQESRQMIEPSAEVVEPAAPAEAVMPLAEVAAQPAATEVVLAETAPEEVAQPQPEAFAAQPVAAPVAAQPQRGNTPRPMAVARASAIPTQSDAGQAEHAAPKQSSGLTSWVKQVAGVMGGGERVVPGSERVVGDYGPGDQVPSVMAQQQYAPQAYAGPQQVPGYVPAGPGLGRPLPMGAAGVGMPPVPMRGDGPNMPNYAWPSYAAYPNYAALQYPTQYSPTAWPYIGPFYPYPQVPLGWRRVSLEWDDGWWFLDFDDRAQHH
jgi:hypothetical protein